MAVSETLITTAAEAGANMIIIGVPFSDPVAESPIIQKAEEQALANGCNVDKIFEMAKRVHYKVQIPLLLNVYANLVFVYGTNKFLDNCIQSGIEGLFIPDLPFEEREEFAAACKKRAVQLISGIVPTDDDRLAKITSGADGFFQCTVGNEITSQTIPAIADLVAKIKQLKNLPCAVNFDFITAEQAKQVATAADGIIVSGQIVQILEQNGQNEQTAQQAVAKYLQSLRDAIDFSG